MFNSALSVVTSLLAVSLDLVAAALAVGRWTRHPVVSMLVLAATVLHLGTRGLYWVGPMVLHGVDGSSLEFMYMGGALMGTAASGLMLAAVFVERPSGPPDEPQQEEQPPTPAA